MNPGSLSWEREPEFEASRALEPEPWKGSIRMQTRGEQTAQLELDSIRSLVDRFDVTVAS